MINFNNDYGEGAHNRIINALSRTNTEYTSPYGEDEYCKEAANLIKKKVECENTDIHFLVGGTQTNLIALSHMLKPFQAVIAAKTAHIYVHETGAIEATGHKVISVETTDGKLTPKLILEVLKEHETIHMVQPKVVYISNSTELGTIYHKDELILLRKLCDEWGLYLYIDGARLASALTSKSNDIFFQDYPKFADAFYIGGTKNGMLFGEALVIVNDNLKTDIRYGMKQRGGILAKGRLLGIQFVELFKEDLYLELGKHANLMAGRLKNGLQDLGFQFLVDSDTNQQFPIIEKTILEKLSKKYLFSVQKEIDDNKVCIRLVTSWATKEEDVEAFIQDLSNFNCIM